MTLYVWIDENGNWRVSHFLPGDGSKCLMILLPDDSELMFMDEDTSEQVKVEVRP